MQSLPQSVAQYMGSAVAALTPRQPRRSLGLAAVFLVVALLLPAWRASAGNCLKDNFGKSVQCTANDVRVAQALSPVKNLDGSILTSCQSGQLISFVADFKVVTGATARENIGLYFATAGQASALTGTCSANIIAPPHSSSNPACTVPLGSNHYDTFDPAPDNCGDSSSSDPNGGTQIVTVEVDDVTCLAGPDGNLRLPACTSWQQPGGTIQCMSPPPNYPYEIAAVPGSPSKCNCNTTLTVPIAVQSAQVSVTKTPNPLSQPEPGGDFGYTVVVTNKANFGSVTINQICDDKFGQIAPASGSCAPGTIGAATAQSCSPSLPATLANPNDSVTCTFTGTYKPGVEGSLIDTVTVNAVDSSNKAITPAPQASATVTVSEVAPQAQVHKSLDSNQCATVKYDVEVANTSATGSDETETLTVLNDVPYGDITKVQGNVLSTTCALGGTIAVGQSYKCSFDGKFCGALGTNTGCASLSGLEQIDTVTATLTGDETSETLQSNATLTVDACFTSH